MAFDKRPAVIRRKVGKEIITNPRFCRTRRIHIIEDYDVWDFELTEEEDALNGLKVYGHRGLGSF